jgi:hypothetical protein
MRPTCKGWLGRLAFAVLAVGLAAARASAEPLDLSDTTPRSIRVEFETSLSPLTIGQVFSAPVAASYSVTGNTGTVVIASANYASAIQTQLLDYFGYMMTWSLVPGSASAFVLHIDLTTKQATAELATYDTDIQSPVQQLGDVARTLSTTATAGFTVLPQYPNFPFFCPTCLLVPGAPYDPVTGKLNAVGSDHLDAPDIDLTSFSRAGDLRLSESPAPAVPALSAVGIGSLVVALAGFACLRLRRERIHAARTVQR